MIKRLPILFLVMGAVLIFFGVTNPFMLDPILCAVVIIFGVTEMFMAIYEKHLIDLEERLSRFIYDFDSDDLPMQQCNICGRKFDMDYPKCPYCEVKRLKRRWPGRSNDE